MLMLERTMTSEGFYVQLLENVLKTKKFSELEWPT